MGSLSQKNGLGVLGLWLVSFPAAENGHAGMATASGQQEEEQDGHQEQQDDGQGQTEGQKAVTAKVALPPLALRTRCHRNGKVGAPAPCCG